MVRDIGVSEVYKNVMVLQKDFGWETERERGKRERRDQSNQVSSGVRSSMVKVRDMDKRMQSGLTEARLDDDL